MDFPPLLMAPVLSSTNRWALRRTTTISMWLIRAITIVGKNMGPTFSYEGMLAFGTSQGTDTLGGQSAAAKIDPLFGAYLRARQELAPGLEVFGRLGAASMVKNLDGAYFAIEASSKRMGGFSYGLGVKVRINRKASFVTDYTSYYNRREETIDGVSLGLAIDY